MVVLDCLSQRRLVATAAGLRGVGSVGADLITSVAAFRAAATEREARSSPQLSASGIGLWPPLGRQPQSDFPSGHPSGGSHWDGGIW